VAGSAGQRLLGQAEQQLAGAFDVPTVSGKRRRIVVYGKTREQARDKMNKALQDARAGKLVPDEVWKLGPYLDYWLENFVKRNRRPATYTSYEMNIRLYLKPGLGNHRLTALTVANVQQFFNQRLQEGDSVRKVQVMRTVLSAALSRAIREELISRNVARLVELPEWHAGTVRPWTAEEARQFLAVSEPDPLHGGVRLAHPLWPAPWRSPRASLARHRLRSGSDPHRTANPAGRR
jgi:hypothetical protein